MRFRVTALLLAAATVLAGVKFFPAVLAHIHYNGEIRELVKHPDTVFHDFSRCRQEVEDASHSLKIWLNTTYRRLLKKKLMRNVAQEPPRGERIVMPGE